MTDDELLTLVADATNTRTWWWHLDYGGSDGPPIGYADLDYEWLPGIPETPGWHYDTAAWVLSIRVGSFRAESKCDPHELGSVAAGLRAASDAFHRRTKRAGE